MLYCKHSSANDAEDLVEDKVASRCTLLDVEVFRKGELRVVLELDLSRDEHERAVVGRHSVCVCGEDVVLCFLGGEKTKKSKMLRWKGVVYAKLKIVLKRGNEKIRERGGK